MGTWLPQRAYFLLLVVIICQPINCLRSPKTNSDRRRNSSVSRGEGRLRFIILQASHQLGKSVRKLHSTLRTIPSSGARARLLHRNRRIQLSVPMAATLGEICDINRRRHGLFRLQENCLFRVNLNGMGILIAEPCLPIMRNPSSRPWRWLVQWMRMWRGEFWAVEGFGSTVVIKPAFAGFETGND